MKVLAQKTSEEKVQGEKAAIPGRGGGRGDDTCPLRTGLRAAAEDRSAPRRAIPGEVNTGGLFKEFVKERKGKVQGGQEREGCRSRESALFALRCEA